MKGTTKLVVSLIPVPIVLNFLLRRKVIQLLEPVGDKTKEMMGEKTKYMAELSTPHTCKKNIQREHAA